MKLSKEEVTKVLNTITNMQPTDLRHAENAIRAKRARIMHTKTLAYRPGQTVQFLDDNGKLVSATVNKTNRYTVQLNVKGSKHRINPDQLIKPLNTRKNADRLMIAK